MESVGILTIATNKYFEYWQDQVTSVGTQLLPNYQVTFHIFTNQIERASQFASTHQQLTIKIHEIPAYGWPEATLLRYEIYTMFKKQLQQDYLMHLDADMIAEGTMEPYLKPQYNCDGMWFVAHPGFWRPSGYSRFLFYLENPKYVIRDVGLLFKYGALGTWEKNKDSNAYVPRKSRSKYACGGIWLGKRTAFIEFASELAGAVRRDQSSGIVAKWHDESHLNKWISMRDCSLLSPALCHDATYRNLEGIESVITAVRKQ